MPSPLVASLTLKLDDQLGGGLTRLTELLDRFAGIAKNLAFGNLGKAGEQFDALLTKIGRTNEAMGRLERTTREAGAAFGWMGRMAADGLAGAFEEARKLPGKLKAFTEAGSGLVSAGFGAAAEGYAVLAPAEAYADRDKLLRRQAIMEGLRGQAVEVEIARLNRLVNADALRNGVSSESVAEARLDLLGQGIPPALVDAALRTHTEAAKAYSIPPELLGPVTGALLGNLKIAPNEADLGGALAALAKEDQTGRFKMVDFAHALPGLTGVAASLGMTGRGALNELAAGVEISTRTAVDPTQAGVNFQDLLGYITSNREDNLARRKLGLDMPALLLEAQKHETNPLDAYLAQIRKLTAGKSPLEQAQVISRIVTNQQARLALLALVQHFDEFQARQNSLNGVGGDKLKTDLASSLAGPDTPLKQMNENFGQLTRTLGQGFMPVLVEVNKALGWINEKLAWAVDNYPKTTAAVLGSIAGLLALSAVLTVLGAVIPVFTAGWGLIAGVFGALLPIAGGLFNAFKYGMFVLEYFTGIAAAGVAAIGALALVLAGAAIDIYEHWDRFRSFFVAMWDGIKAVAHGAYEFFAGVFTGDMHRAVDGLELAWGGLEKFFTNLWNVVKKLFVDFGQWVDDWTGGIFSKLGKGIDSLTASVPPAARAAGTRGAEIGPRGGSPLSGAHTVHVTVVAEPGTRVTAASGSPGVTINTPVSRGPMSTRP